jgi:hypothetical protein
MRLASTSLIRPSVPRRAASMPPSFLSRVNAIGPRVSLFLNFHAQTTDTRGARGRTTVNIITVTYNAFNQVSLGGEREGDVRNKSCSRPLNQIGAQTSTAAWHYTKSRRVMMTRLPSSTTSKPGQRRLRYSRIPGVYVEWRVVLHTKRQSTNAGEGWVGVQERYRE